MVNIIERLQSSVHSLCHRSVLFSEFLTLNQASNRALPWSHGAPGFAGLAPCFCVLFQTLRSNIFVLLLMKQKDCIIVLPSKMVM